MLKSSKNNLAYQEVREICAYGLEFLAYLLFAATSLRSIFKEGILAIQDLSTMYEVEQLYRPFEFPWDHSSNLGSPSVLIGNLLYNLPLILLSKVIGSVILAHKVFFLLLLPIGALGQQLVFERLVGKKGFVTGFLYMVNPWVCYRISRGHNLMLLGYAFLPYVFLSYLSYRRRYGLFAGLSFSVLLSLLILISPHMAYIFFLILAVYAITKAITFKREGLREVLLKFARELVLIIQAGCLSMFLSMPALIPALKGLGSQVTVVRSEELIYYSLRLEILIQRWPYVIMGALTGVLALFLFKRKGDQNSLFSLSLMFLGILLSSGGVKPLRSAFVWLFENFPGFFLFRELNKFLYLTFFGLSILLGALSLSFQEQLAKLAKDKRARKIYSTLLTSTIVAVIILTYPSMVLGNFQEPIDPVVVPEDFMELNRWLRNQPGDFRVAFFPPACWATRYNWSKKWFLDPLVALQSKPTVEIKSEMDITPSSSFVRWCYASIYNNKTRRIGKLLGIIGVKYIVLRPDADMPEDRKDLHMFAKERTLAIFSEESDLMLEEVIGRYQIYRNPHVLPIISAQEAPILIIGDRKTLITLSHIDSFEFSSNHCLFLDNFYDLDFEKLLSECKYVVIEPERELDLTLATTKEKRLIFPWEFVGLSSNSLADWIRGDFAWFLYNGSLHVAPDNYVMTRGENRSFSFNFEISKSGEFSLFIQSFHTSNKEFGRISVRLDEFPPVIVQCNSFGVEGSYLWEHVGDFFLSEGSHQLSIASVEGGAALSKLVLVPKGSLQNAGLVEAFQESKIKVTLLFDDEFWALKGKGCSYLESPEYSNGRALLLNGQIKAQFLNPKEGEYFIGLRANALKEGGVLTLTLDNTSFSLKLQNGLQWLELGPIKIGAGQHNIMLYEVEGNVSVDFLVLYEGKEFLGLEPNPDLWYMKQSSSSYTIRTGARFLSFLETYDSHWKLVYDRDQVSPMKVFGFGNMYKLEWRERQEECRLLFTGVNLMKKGVFIGLVGATLILLSIYLCKSKGLIY